MSEHQNNANRTFWSVLFECQIGVALLACYIVASLLGASSLLLGGFALGAILFAMNGLSKSRLLFGPLGPKFWREHKAFKFFHHVTDEGELAGIFVAIVVFGSLMFQGAHMHFPFAECFTLLGIMSAANLAVRNMIPIMGWIEKVTGVWGVIFFGSLLSSLTGEPAAAVFLSNYIKDRTDVKNKAKVATGLAATIGSGGGLMPFAAPPVLIVWGVLSSTLGWGLGTLLLLIGIPCVFHVALVATRFGKYINKERSLDSKKYAPTPLWVLGAIVIMNIAIPHSIVAWSINSIIGVFACMRGKTFEEKWQPLILAFLLMGLEIVGQQADPLLQWLGAMIPATLPFLSVCFILFYLSTFTSHFADNALASRVYMSVALALGVTFGGDSVHILAMSVVLGALFGGFALIPANLPNFPIARFFGVKAGPWAKTAAPSYYWTGIVHIVWITAIVLLGKMISYPEHSSEPAKVEQTHH